MDAEPALTRLGRVIGESIGEALEIMNRSIVEAVRQPRIAPVNKAHEPGTVLQPIDLETNTAAVLGGAKQVAKSMKPVTGAQSMIDAMKAAGPGFDSRVLVDPTLLAEVAGLLENASELELQPTARRSAATYARKIRDLLQ